jgi:hypothetical protein
LTSLRQHHLQYIDDDSSTVNTFGGSLTDAARVIIYDHHMFIVQVTGGSISLLKKFDYVKIDFNLYREMIFVSHISKKGLRTLFYLISFKFTFFSTSKAEQFFDILITFVINF